MTAESYIGLEPDIRRAFREHLPPVAASVITTKVFDRMKVSLEERTGTCRKKEFVQARQIAMYIIRKKTRSSLVNIGLYFKKDHSTVIYAIETTEDLMKTDKYYRSRVEQLLEEIEDEPKNKERYCLNP